MKEITKKNLYCPTFPSPCQLNSYRKCQVPCILKEPTGSNLLLPLKLHPRVPANFHPRFRPASVTLSVQNKRNMRRQDWPTLTPRAPAWRKKHIEAGLVWTRNQTGPLNPGLSHRMNPGRANRSRGKPVWTSRCLWCFPPVAPESEPGCTPPNSSAPFWADRSSATPSRPSRGTNGSETGQRKCFLSRFKKPAQVWAWQGCWWGTDVSLCQGFLWLKVLGCLQKQQQQH